jgi:hypothetical protein
MPARKTTIAIAAPLPSGRPWPCPCWRSSAPASGPVARYDMRAGTVSGMGGMGGGMGMPGWA